MTGPGTLGILVTTDLHLRHLIGLARAARRQGHPVIVFFTHRGVLLTRDPAFAELDGLADMSLCRQSLEAFGFNPADPIPGIPPRNIANQARHADLIDRADRYLVL